LFSSWEFKKEEVLEIREKRRETNTKFYQ